MRHSGGPRISFRERPSASTFIKEWTRPKNGTRAGSGIRNRGPATIGVPAENFVREAEASHCVDPCGQLHAAGRHLHDVRAAGCVEHVRTVEEAREALTILAVADEAEAAGGRKFARSAAHVAAPTLKREIEGHACHIHAGDHEIHREFFGLAKFRAPERVSRRPKPPHDGS
jgi:hypothetical protein